MWIVVVVGRGAALECILIFVPASSRARIEWLGARARGQGCQAGRGRLAGRDEVQVDDAVLG